MTAHIKKKIAIGIITDRSPMAVNPKNNAIVAKTAAPIIPVNLPTRTTDRDISTGLFAFFATS